MTIARDLAWHNLDLIYHSSIAHQFARYALALDYRQLPQDVVHQAKRCLLDALGCAIGAYEAPGRAICEAVVKALGGPDEATVFGSGFRTSATNATLVNSFLVRFLDYNDLGGGGHNSDSIPAILAVSERHKTGGPDLLTSLVISYELGARVTESVTDSSGGFERKGWTSDIRGGLNIPPAVGKLMGLSEEQIANAIGACACHSLPLGILDAHKEENVMSKNLRLGFVAFNAILVCMLAQKGFTGPVRIVEGDKGLREVILDGDMDLERMVDFSGWRILKTRHKSLCMNATTQGHVSATLEIVKEHDLKPEDVAAVRIKAGLREVRHTTTAAKKYPRTAENADHSAFYANAFAIKERSFGPESADPKYFSDPVILDLIEKISVEVDPGLPERSFGGASEITTRDGRRFIARVDMPHGLGDDPLSDKELEQKFENMALKYLPEQQVTRLLDIIWNIEKLDDVRKLAALMIFPGRS